MHAAATGRFALGLAFTGLTLLGLAALNAQRGPRRDAGPNVPMTLVLGEPTDHSIILSITDTKGFRGYVEHGTTPGAYTQKTSIVTAAANQPAELAIGELPANARCYYRLRFEHGEQGSFEASPEHSFMTQRAPSSTFSFGVQGDSHPERAGKMFNPELYLRTIDHVRTEDPDLYFMLGDDFSIENLIGNRDISQQSVDQVYARQRAYLTRMTSSTPLFLVNGNHEEAAGALLDGTANNPAVYAGRARTKFFPLPAPDNFYTGDATPVENIGLLRDYYAFTWGDALFVVIDPYWHSKVIVDAEPGGQGGGGQGGGRRGGGGQGGGGRSAQQDNPRQQGEQRGGGKGSRDLWQVTLGDEQYAWLKKTLESSHAKYKFVLEHHILGTGRGGVDIADTYEWGGRNRRGDDEFRQHRPGWAMPIHQLFVKTGVTIFFQGHDHLFAHQQKDGVVYQETPNPADDTYTAFNREAYRSGDILPNAGHLRVVVSPQSVRVDYIRSFLPSDETADQKDGETAFSYTVVSRTAGLR